MEIVLFHKSGGRQQLTIALGKQFDYNVNVKIMEPEQKTGTKYPTKILGGNLLC